MGLYRGIENGIRNRFSMYKPVGTPRPPTETATGGAALIGPGYNAETEQPLQGTFKIRTLLGGFTRSVPVFYEDKGGQDASLWPCITFRMESERARQDNWRINTPLTRNLGTTSVFSTNQNANLYGTDLVESIDSPDPVTITYEFRVWSLNHEEAQELLEIVKALFPMKDFLEIETNDGCTRTYDMMRTDGPTFVGGQDPTLDIGEEGYRFYSWRLLYDIEAYEDNTLLTTLGSTVKRREIAVTSESNDTSNDEFVVDLDLPGSL